MDVHPPANVASSSSSYSLLDFFPHEPFLEGGEDESLEWLSIYVEYCLSSSTSYINLSTPKPTTTSTTSTTRTPTTRNNPKNPQNPHRNPLPNTRTKRRRLSKEQEDQDHHHVSLFLDPPLLTQTQWLAVSELIFPKKHHDYDRDQEIEERSKNSQSVDMEAPVRRCSHCMSQKTPQWRAGPLGPKTLCNACGVRFKSGRLLPEYRPAKSPTFVSYKHSNSHKKVMEMRMAVLSSPNQAS